MIRQARPSDLAGLLAIEQASFSSDRLSRRSFRHLLTEANSLTLLDEENGQLRGYVTLLYRTNVSLARIYSIATAPVCLGRGVGTGLLLAAERQAAARNCVALRLEIRKDNPASLQLFAGRGYQLFGEYPAYYEDGMDAVRLEKTLTAACVPSLRAAITTARPSALPAAPPA